LGLHQPWVTRGSTRQPLPHARHVRLSPRAAACLVRMIHGARARPIQKDGALQRLLTASEWWVDLGLRQPWVDPPAASTCKAHAAISSGCGPCLVRMIHGARDRPIQKDGASQPERLLVGGLGPAPAVGRPASRFHMQGTCGCLLGLRPVPSANDPRRKGPCDTEERDRTAPAGGRTWTCTSRGSTRRRFHMQGTCGCLLGLRPVPSANDPRPGRKGPCDTEGRDLTTPAGRLCCIISNYSSVVRFK